jgi:TPR repeat protein
LHFNSQNGSEFLEPIDILKEIATKYGKDIFLSSNSALKPALEGLGMKKSRIGRIKSIIKTGLLSELIESAPGAIDLDLFSERVEAISNRTKYPANAIEQTCKWILKSIGAEMEVKSSKTAASELEGAVHLLKSAEQGDLKSIVDLGLHYESLGNFKEAAKWLAKAGDQGSAKAMVALGWLYCEKFADLPKHYDQAVAWFRKAADLNDPDAQYALGTLQVLGLGTGKNPKSGAKLCLASALSGNAKAKLMYGLLCLEGEGVAKNQSEAFIWLKEAAEAGEMEAQTQLGNLYAHGVGTQRNISESIKWHRSAAEQGSAESQCVLGYIFANGINADKDEEEAVKLYKSAADQGLPEAQNLLAKVYLEGKLTSKNPDLAAKLLTQSAESGNAQACRLLSELYQKGIGVEKDPESSRKWINKANFLENESFQEHEASQQIPDRSNLKRNRKPWNN